MLNFIIILLCKIAIKNFRNTAAYLFVIKKRKKLIVVSLVNGFSEKSRLHLKRISIIIQNAQPL